MVNTWNNCVSFHRYFDNDIQTNKLFASKLLFITKPIGYINFKDTRYRYREQLTLYSLWLYLVSLKCQLLYGLRSSRKDREVNESVTRVSAVRWTVSSQHTMGATATIRVPCVSHRIQLIISNSIESRVASILYCHIHTQNKY